MLWVALFGDIGTLRTLKVCPEMLAPQDESSICTDSSAHEVNSAGNVRVIDTSPNSLTQSSPRGELGGVMGGVTVPST